MTPQSLALEIAEELNRTMLGTLPFPKYNDFRLSYLRGKKDPGMDYPPRRRRYGLCSYKRLEGQ